MEQIYTKEELVKMPFNDVMKLEHEAWKYYKKIQAIMEFMKIKD